MFWVCPMCSSNNEGGATVCMVCGTLRPSAVLRYDIQSQMNSASGGVSDLLGAFRTYDAEAAYRDAVRLLTVDATAGFAAMLECAGRGYAPAQYRVGLCYDRGIGVAKDGLQAVYWYKQAARAGVSSAQVELGDCYRAGRGTIKDAALAYHWYREAAERDDAAGQYRLGLCYAHGIGVKADREKAICYFKQAAQGGNAEAKAALLAESS